MTARDLSIMPITSRHFGGSIPQTQPSRIGLRPLLIGGFAGFILVVLSGAFLIGLAVVGLLAAVIGGFELARRHLRRPARAPLGALDRRVIGYP